MTIFAIDQAVTAMKAIGKPMLVMAIVRAITGTLIEVKRPIPAVLRPSLPLFNLPEEAEEALANAERTHEGGEIPKYAPPVKVRVNQGIVSPKFFGIALEIDITENNGLVIQH